jgi:hypothetical protein
MADKNEHEVAESPYLGDTTTDKSRKNTLTIDVPEGVSLPDETEIEDFIRTRLDSIS